MVNENIHSLMSDPVLLNQDTLSDLETLVKKYPYFQTGRMLHLKNLQTINDTRFSNELKKTALYVGDRNKLFHYIEGEPLKIRKEHYQRQDQSASAGRTIALIDAFLSDKKNTSTEVEKEIEQPAKISGNIPLPKKMLASYDYLTFLLTSHENEPENKHENEQKHEPEEKKDPPKEPVRLQHQELIDNFISENKEGEKIYIKPPTEDVYNKNIDNQKEKEEKEEFFSVTLAKIYIKQKRYEKALEIIRKLNLKFPEKNAFFADQIRFLELLIANTKTI